MKYLRIGKMKSKEIADWFNITMVSYKILRKQKLKELEKYADFTVVYGGVIIIRIKYPVYMKKRR